MQKKPLHIKVPGKLMVAGEYAVLEPYHSAIVMAVNRFVYAEIEEAESNRVSLLNLNLIMIPWFYEQQRVTIDSSDKRKKFVQNAMTIALRFLEENSINPAPFSLTIKSELDDDKSGLKLGLGSSAAVVTAVVASILKKFYDPNSKKELIFKLAAIAHVQTQGSGSGADIAASTFSGLLHYQSFQAKWLLDTYKEKKTITELVHSKWPYLMIEQIDLPTELQVAFGWTGKPASTKNLIREIYKNKNAHHDLFQSFLKESERAIRLFILGVNERNKADIIESIKLNRHALHMLEQKNDVKIETHLLKQLAEIAAAFGGAGKLSGAGGGDCGIAFVTSASIKKDMMKAWVNAGIKPLGIHMYIETKEIK